MCLLLELYWKQQRCFCHVLKIPLFWFCTQLWLLVYHLGLSHLNQFVLKRDLDQNLFWRSLYNLLHPIFFFLTSKGSYLTNILPIEKVPINVKRYPSKSFDILPPIRNAVFYFFYYCILFYCYCQSSE